MMPGFIGWSKGLSGAGWNLLMTRLTFPGLALAAIASLLAPPALADKISHPTAVFSGLDKITGRIISFEVATDETVQFGSLQITERACYTAPSTEAPQTVTFVQVDEVDVKKQYKRIFSGWMFAASPGLNGIEHPVYDIWLTDCKGGGTDVVQTPPEAANTEPPPNAKLPVKTDKKPRNADANAQHLPAGAADATPRRDPNRRPPSRSFFPDEAGGRDPGGLY
jgi:hypothetical protein